jgi:putative toxin-antitoxin system antitoxin component (TIGR02293 family)
MATTRKKHIASPKAGSAAREFMQTDEQAKPLVRGLPPAQGKFVVTAKPAVDLLESVSGVSSGDRAALLDKVKEGLLFEAVVKLEEAYRVSRKELAKLISIPLTTLARRKKDGVLHTDESDRVARFAQIKDATLAMMQGDNNAAVQWLRTPLPILGGESPQEHAITEIGAVDVRELIGRIRHGVFS